MARKDVPKVAIVWLVLNALSACSACYGALELRPPPELVGQPHAGGPGDGLFAAVFISLPIMLCLLLDLAGLGLLIWALAKKRGYWPVVTAAAILVLWAGALLFMDGVSGPR